MAGKGERECTGCEVPIGSSEWPEGSLTAWTVEGKVEIKKVRKAEKASLVGNKER